MLAEQRSPSPYKVALKPFTGGEPFKQTLAKHGIKLERTKCTTLQINIGFLCNQACRHCHLSAGPGRTDNMDSATVRQVIAYARKSGFDAVDVTGGAPELNPNLMPLIEGVASDSPRVMLRSNLSALRDDKASHLMDFLKSYRVVIVASFPSTHAAQADSQRGRGMFQASIAVLRKLNAMGYGHEESGLELDLVSNPTGAFLPASQAQTEKRFRDVLKQKWGITFNHLFAFANVPLGRFRQWLVWSGNFEPYMERLISSFNPCAVEGLMCRTLVSVSWDGYLYDCDFNLARDLPMGGRKTHVSEMHGPPEPGDPIAVADHCYTCTAGAGFT